MKILVKVTPNSKIEELGQEGDKFVVKVKEPAKKGKANQALIKLLSEHFSVPLDQVRILSGFRNRNKIVEVRER
ncbi:MAG: DUF167 domain-containing protein [Chloroflexota bacterium]|nr:DUF167 domain-containing protein [Chloroflexota bacterium]